MTEHDLLTPGEVARIFRVHPKTVWRWAQEGLIKHIVTPGGHYRYYVADVESFLGRPIP